MATKMSSPKISSTPISLHSSQPLNSPNFNPNVVPLRETLSQPLHKSLTKSKKLPPPKSDLEYFESEQKIIDSTLNYLTNFSLKKKGPGRPSKKNISSPSKLLPKTLDQSLKTLTNISDLHPGVLIDLLNKTNDLSKKILSEFYALSRKYDELEAKLKNQTTYASDSSHKPVLNSTSSVLNEENDYDLGLRVDFLEQKSNLSTVVLSGDDISNIVKDSQKSELKENVASLLKRKVANVEPSEISELFPLGKEKKSLKLTCSTENIKRKLISSAKQSKSPNLYVNEFLTKKRYQLFHQARLLKKKYPSSNLIVYTRFGDIYFKITREGKYQKISTLGQISALERILDEKSEDPGPVPLSPLSATSTTDCPVSRSIANAMTEIELTN